jgi:drug/metabolite transporter (DMT)-like permease
MDRSAPLPCAALLGAAACFAGNIIVGRAMHGIVPPFALTFWRWLLVVAVLAPFTAPMLWRERALVRRHWLLLTALGTGSVTLYNGFFYLGVQRSTAINGALVTSTIPLLIALCAWLITRERVSARQAAAIALSLAGVAVILARGDPHVLATLRFGAGDVWILAASLCWALYSVLLRYSPRELAGLPFVGVTSLAGVVTILPVYAWERASGASMTVNAASLGAIAFLALFPALLAYFLYSRAVVAVGPNRAGLFLHVSPVFAIAAAIAFLGETLHGYHVAGVALIALGLYLNTRAARRRG